MIETRVKSPNPLGVTLVQCFPPSRVKLISPSSEPVQMSPFTRGDSAIAKIVPQYSAVVWSSVIGPPEGPSVAGSWRVRSGDTTVQLRPSLVGLNATVAP